MQGNHDLPHVLLEYGPKLVTALLAVMVAYAAAKLALQFTSQKTDTIAATAPVPESFPAKSKPLVSGKQIAAWHLFGKPTETANVPQTRIDAPETKLDLSLKGIVATDDKTDGYAIIQKPDKEEQHFKVKDSVFGLATLEEIYVDRVILLHNGRYETLRLPLEFMASDLFLEHARKKEAKRIVSNFRQKLINRDGMELIKMFGFDTAYKNGGFVGFTVHVMGEDGARMLEVLGVEEGDLITAVNGKRFAESLEAVQSLTQLRDAIEVDVEIERNGVPMFFHFDFTDLEQTTSAEETTTNLIEDSSPEPEADTDAVPPEDESTL